MSKAREFLKQATELEAAKQIHRHRAELSTTKSQRKELLAEVARLEDTLALSLNIASYSKGYEPPKIVTREKGRAHEGMVTLLVSDIHPEEVIKPETVNGLNDFNPEICKQRFHKLIEGFRWYLEAVRAGKGEAGYTIRDMMLVLGGDLISNTIHPDLAESNAMGPADALIFTFERICEVIDAVLQDKQLSRIIVPCVAGNHDRGTQKIRHQTRAQTSLATILYYHLADRYRDEKRLVFDITRSNMVYTDVYGKLVRTVHGDDVKYMGGTGGIHIPLRRRLDRWNQTRQAAITNVHHFHTFMLGQDYVVNGSVIGHTAYSQNCGFSFEPASQVAYIIDPQRGKRLAFPIQLQDCPGHWG